MLQDSEDVPWVSLVQQWLVLGGTMGREKKNLVALSQYKVVLVNSRWDMGQ